MPALLGLGTGILSAWGIGGGTLLLLCMTLFLQVEQQTAQAINLLYFLPTAGVSLLLHRKNGCLDTAALRSAAPWGAAAAGAAALLAPLLDTGLLRRAFGLLLLYAALSLFRPAERGK